MANNFITNHASHRTLKGRLNTLISISDELKFLVGFFYFSGWQQLFENLRANEGVTLKLLVGLQVDALLSGMVEHGRQEPEMSHDDVFNRFITSLGNAINNEEMDNEEFYTQVRFFLHMVDEGRLLIRKTENPNHAKLYLFRLNSEQANIQNMQGQFVTGSSNLTKAGLSGQEEFNVEIRDYGFADAETYFDELWERGIPITEVPDRAAYIKKFIEHRSQAATITPFEAYMLILKTYLDLQHTKQIKPAVEAILEDIGFKKFSYQTDAVNQALSIIEAYNGVIIADVVGLGKSVIASMIAKNINRRGMVICPPGLIGERSYHTGWWGYIEDFRMGDWLVESRGKLPEIAETIDNKGIEVVVIDEAHYFRNQDTEDYEALLKICRDRTVILLTATPFNNSPTDIFSLLKLFMVPGRSGITLEDNLEGVFRGYSYRFKQLSEISKNHNSKNGEKRRKAEYLYQQFVAEELPIDLAKVRAETKHLADRIKHVIAPVVIRRNRLDLKKDHQYSKEVGELSEVADPKELYFYLNKEQAAFYDRIMDEYFAEEGRFKGAIYQPFFYEEIVEDEEKLDEEGNRAYIQQRNLFDFMRRLLVKRFESSFGAFASSIDRFIYVHEVVQKFIKTSKNQYILDRKLMEKLNSLESLEEEELNQILFKFENDLLNKKVPKNNKIYKIDEFKRKDEFLADIQNDLDLFKEVKKTLEKLNIIAHDPKSESLATELEGVIGKGKAKRKVVIFSEYTDTVKHLEPFLRKKYGNRLLVCDGKLSKELAKQLQQDFNAQYKGTQSDHFDVLLTTDKLAEGFNLNRAGTIINYDIPWNPTRVIQRVGRINRIGAKVYDELYIYNFFPSEVGATIVRSREIASQKMFLIHSALGEDAKIFHADEEPSAAKLYSRINESPDDDGELNLTTVLRNKFDDLAKKYPDVVERVSELPARVKTAKSADEPQLNVLQRKGLSLFTQIVKAPAPEGNVVEELSFEELLPFVECEFEEPRLDLTKNFWPAYEEVKNYKPKHKVNNSELSLENKALNNLKIGLRLCSPKEQDLGEFMKVLVTDIKKYRTLSSRTLGRIGRKELKPDSPAKVKQAFYEEIRWIMEYLGADYLDNLLKSVQGQKNEVIIAVENR
jgi:SNF2 family DNA or RNA helicase